MIIRLRINDHPVDKEKGYHTEVTEMATKLVSLMGRVADAMFVLCTRAKIGAKVLHTTAVKFCLTK